MRNVRTDDSLRLIALSMVLVCLMAALCGCSNKSLPEQPGETIETATVPSESSDTQIQQPQDEETAMREENFTEVPLTYLNVRMPEEMANLLRLEEITEGDTHMTVVFLDTEESNWELYRICFGKEYADSAIGTWDIDGEKIPVAVVTEVHDMTENDDDQKLETYSYAMESLQYVMSAIRDDARFQREEEVTIQKSDAKAGYWNFEMVEDMECEEEVSEDTCKLSFYGTVNGERYLLYTICIGEETLTNVLGTYQVEGTARQVSIESCEPPSAEGWSEAEETKLYAMMDSINDVIHTIMESEGFAALEVE